MAATSTMARPQSENTFQVAFKIPEAWVEMADELAEAMSRPGISTTRTDALRAALYRGLEVLRGEELGVAGVAATTKRTTIPRAPESKPKKR